MKAWEFMKYKNWAVAGDVLNSQKYAFRIKNSLEAAGFKVCGVKPGVQEEKEQVFSTLKDVPYNIDVLDLCINPKSGVEIVKDAADLGIKMVLIQPGAESREILNFCKENNINSVEGCALVELSNM